MSYSPDLPRWLCLRGCLTRARPSGSRSRIRVKDIDLGAQRFGGDICGIYDGVPPLELAGPVLVHNLYNRFRQESDKRNPEVSMYCKLDLAIDERQLRDNSTEALPPKRLHNISQRR